MLTSQSGKLLRSSCQIRLIYPRRLGVLVAEEQAHKMTRTAGPKKNMERGCNGCRSARDFGHEGLHALRRPRAACAGPRAGSDNLW